MNVGMMSGRALNWVTAVVIDRKGVAPADWSPTTQWDQVEDFWKMKNASCSRTNPHRLPAAGCVGDGPYEATADNYVARGSTPLEAICRVMVCCGFGSTSVDVPEGYRR